MQREDFTREEFSELCSLPRQNSRKRFIKVFQNDDYEGAQFCLNVIQPESYIRSHCRFVDETVIHYRGILCSLQFKNDGTLLTSKIINGDRLRIALPAHTFQTIVSLEENSALWMITHGKHDKNNYCTYLSDAPDERGDFHSYFEKLREVAVNTFHAYVRH